MIGCDLCHIPRMAEALEKQGDRLVKRVLTPEEQAVAPSPITAHFVAKRWAAKEAVAKALGTGIGEKVGFQEITIQKHESGQPYATVKGYEDTTFTFNLSLSDDGDYALAFCTTAPKE